jgi:pimeloyl-ACP methyl ester carboxylesterase
VRRLVAAIIAILLVAGGVGYAIAGLAKSEGQHEVQAPVTPEPGSEKAPQKSLKRYYGQTLAWKACGDHDCARLRVPFDYRHPNAKAITLALLRVPASGHRIGSLVVNPGGPGAAGTGYAAAGGAVFGAPLLEHYDIVGFDPRGTGHSSPVDCLSDLGLDQYVAGDPTPDNAPEERRLVAEATKFGHGCAQRSGALAAHISTLDSARDMDILRSALGQRKLDYLGASYGTKLGATYAELFPRQVGRFVLDGALDPTLTMHQLALGQAGGFQTALDAFVDNCVQTSNNCFLGSSRDAGLARIKGLFDSLDRNPLAVGNRTLTEGNAFYGVALPLYNRDYWVLLSQALKAAFAGDGSALLRLSDAYASRNADGSYADNSLEAFYAISCLDDPSYVTPATAEKQAAQFQKVSPTLGAAFDWSQVSCVGQVATAPEEPPTIDGAGAAPIVVVGTTRDPATPYAWAEALASQLESGVLVTRDGDGHTGYHSGNACVDRAVEGYLVNGKVPHDGLSC